MFANYRYCWGHAQCFCSAAQPLFKQSSSLPLHYRHHTFAERKRPLLGDCCQTCWTTLTTSIMAFLNKQGEIGLDLDHGIRNKFKTDWLTDKAYHDVYGSSGKHVLCNHSQSKHHISRRKCVYIPHFFLVQNSSGNFAYPEMRNSRYIQGCASLYISWLLLKRPKKSATFHRSVPYLFIILHISNKYVKITKL